MYSIANQGNKKFLSVAGHNFILSKTVMIHHKPWATNFSVGDGIIQCSLILKELNNLKYISAMLI